MTTHEMQAFQQAEAWRAEALQVIDRRGDEERVCTLILLAADGYALVAEKLHARLRKVRS